MDNRPDAIARRYQEFFSYLEKLKHIPRTGWMRDGVPHPESVAEHSFKAALIAMVLADSLKIRINKGKLMKMALIHDVGESIIGDLTPYTKKGLRIPKLTARKHKIELQAIKKIFGGIPNGSEYIKLFEEFEAGRTNESKIFGQIDKLEMVFQAAEYERKHGLTLNTYFSSGDAYIYTKELRLLFEDTMKNRRKR